MKRRLTGTSWLVAALAAISISTPSLAAQRTCRASNAELIAAVRSLHDQQRNVGLQVALHFDGRLVFSEVLGMADLEREIPVTRDTTFPLASLTKAYTGVAALKAAAAGHLRLDEPIQGYVPEFPVKRELVVTPRRLAAHRAGIRHWGTERDALYARRFDRVEQILTLFKDDPLLANAGSEYQYSSYGYNLLALAIERSTQTEFTAYVRQQILQPLGLSKTRFDDARRTVAQATKLYSFYDLVTFAELPTPSTLPTRDYSHNMGGGNMSATADDVAKFGAALLAPGFLPRAQHDALFTRPTYNGSSSSMSFGFFVQEPGAERRISITGANPGIQSGLAVYPDRNLAVAVLANTWGVGSRSGDMVTSLPRTLADLCAPGAPRT